jgi:HPt (histidine-containing phosphotransfer) domain-containing protein
MTANAMASDREACLDAGMNDHVGKPFDLDHLVSVLLKHTGFQPPALPIATQQGSSSAIETLATLLPTAAEPAQPISAMIDTQAALQRLSGMKPLYVRLMREFVTELDGTVTEYRRLIAASLLADATRQMHTLKGTAATLGATPLSDFARALEMHCKDPTKAVLKTHQVNELQAIVDATREAVVQVIAHFEDANTSKLPKQSQVSPVDPAETNTLLEQLAELEKLLTQSDLHALERFATFRPHWEAMEIAQFSAFEQALNDLDLPAALILCRDISVRVQTIVA